jgi:predicted nucleic acid-binding protein
VFTALLDTCVLWPSLQRDFLLSLAAEGMYRAVWSTAILDELEFHETAKLIRRGDHKDDAAARAHCLVQQMRTAFDDAEVQGWEGLAGTYGLPDPDDEHVVAAAVMSGAGAIVTHNVKDFPESKLPNGLDVVSPAEFAANTVALDPLRAFDAINAIVERSGHKGPQVDKEDVLEILIARYKMAHAVELMRQAHGPDVAER